MGFLYDCFGREPSEIIILQYTLNVGHACRLIRRAIATQTLRSKNGSMVICPSEKSIRVSTGIFFPKINTNLFPREKNLLIICVILIKKKNNNK